jgi:hypothetical protein
MQNMLTHNCLRKRRTGLILLFFNGGGLRIFYLFFINAVTEQIYVAVTLETCIQEGSSSNLSWDAGCPDRFSWFPHFLNVSELILP